MKRFQTTVLSALPAHLRVRTLILDVDGVLTEGGLSIGRDGEIKTFSCRDGEAIRWFQRSGGKVAFLSARASEALEWRAKDLGIDILAQGFRDKLPELKRICAEFGVDLKDVCYVGDDLIDLACMRAVGLPVAVADASEDTKKAAVVVTRNPGGKGVVREVVEWLLKSQGLWDGVMKQSGIEL
jgi:3-deoxy-D-manno-octulosonate 8-phosphate phosphatase (KDO 8-P phosphatase)